MNCKPGDLAIIISSRNCPELIGHVVEVIRAFVPGSDLWIYWDGSPSWHIRYPDGRLIPRVVGLEARRVPGGDRVFYDRNLRPIRDQPGEDEILRIAGKPCDIKTPEAA